MSCIFITFLAIGVVIQINSQKSLISLTYAIHKHSVLWWSHWRRLRVFLRGCSDKDWQSSSLCTFHLNFWSMYSPLLAGYTFSVPVSIGFVPFILTWYILFLLTKLRHILLRLVINICWLLLVYSWLHELTVDQLLSPRGCKLKTLDVDILVRDSKIHCWLSI